VISYLVWHRLALLPRPDEALLCIVGVDSCWSRVCNHRNLTKVAKRRNTLCGMNLGFETGGKCSMKTNLRFAEYTDSYRNQTPISGAQCQHLTSQYLAKRRRFVSTQRIHRVLFVTPGRLIDYTLSTLKVIVAYLDWVELRAISVTAARCVAWRAIVSDS